MMLSFRQGDRTDFEGFRPEPHLHLGDQGARRHKSAHLMPNECLVDLPPAPQQRSGIAKPMIGVYESRVIGAEPYAVRHGLELFPRQAACSAWAFEGS